MILKIAHILVHVDTASLGGFTFEKILFQEAPSKNLSKW